MKNEMEPDGAFQGNMERAMTAVQKYNVMALAGMLIVVVILSTIHLGVLIVEEILTPPRFLIRVQGLLEIFGYILLVLIGVELIETLKAYVKKDVVRNRGADSCFGDCFLL
jgi:uncharacterized membrane protein (DUF373 family)